MYKKIGLKTRGMIWNTELQEAMELENLLRKTYFGDTGIALISISLGDSNDRGRSQ